VKVEDKYYADGEDAYDMKLDLQKDKPKAGATEEEGKKEGAIAEGEPKTGESADQLAEPAGDKKKKKLKKRR